MKATDEYKVCTLEEAETFARKREHMNKKNFPPHIVDGGASYQKKVEEAPYHPGYEDAVVTPAPKRKDLREMNTGLFDDVHISNPARDKAWEAFIKRKDVAGWAVDKEGFPLNGFYDVWCIAWSKGWDTGYEAQNELLHKAMDDAFKGLESSLELNKVLLKEKNK
jgi:hypothetical protein